MGAGNALRVDPGYDYPAPSQRVRRLVKRTTTLVDIGRALFAQLTYRESLRGALPVNRCCAIYFLLAAAVTCASSLSAALLWTDARTRMSGGSTFLP